MHCSLSGLRQAAMNPASTETGRRCSSTAQPNMPAISAPVQQPRRACNSRCTAVWNSSRMPPSVTCLRACLGATRGGGDRLARQERRRQRGGAPVDRQASLQPCSRRMERLACRSTAEGSDGSPNEDEEATGMGTEGGNKERAGAFAQQERERERSSMESLLDTVEDDAPEFSFPLSVLLAGCAFEAYKEPVAGEGSSSPFEYCENASNGTRTVYVERQFLKSTMAGLLRVRLNSASKLAARDFLGKSDPYCILSVGPSSYRSAICHQTLDPTWDEDFVLYVRNLDQRLQITVADDDWHGADDLIGTSVASLRSLCDGQEHDLELKVLGSLPDSRLSLSVQFEPFTDALATAASQTEMGPPPEDSPVASMPDSWRTLATISGASAEEVFDPVCFIENEDTDTQLWVFCNREKRCVVLAWRGTEQLKWKDLLTDVRLTPTAFNVERVWGGGRSDASDEGINPAAAYAKVAQACTDFLKSHDVAELLAEPDTAGVGLGEEEAAEVKEQAEQLERDSAWVHSGFLEAYDSVHSQVLRVVEDLVCGAAGQALAPGAEQEPQWRIFSTGHSLGGALATLSAYELAERSFRSGARPAIDMYNFGSPRVGNTAFVQRYNRLVPHSWRVLNPRDMVCNVPRLMGYAHVGISVEIRSDGTYTVKAAQREVWSEGGEVHQIVGELAAAALARASADKEGANDEKTAILDRLVAREMELLESIMDGSALAEHMEDVYLKALKEIVDRQGPLADHLDTSRRVDR